jgi:hypothetical protein
MKRSTQVWPALAALLSVVVAYQVVSDSADSASVAQADIPTVAPGADVLAGIMVVPNRIGVNDYRRHAFGEAWADDNDAPGGRNGCDIRNDILQRDLVEKTYTDIKRCPTAVATGTLHDPYTNAVAFTRGDQIGASVQIDHTLSATFTGTLHVFGGKGVDDMPLTAEAP